METFTAPLFARRDIFCPYCFCPELFGGREPSYADDIHDVSRRVPGLCNTVPHGIFMSMVAGRNRCLNRTRPKADCAAAIVMVINSRRMRLGCCSFSGIG